MAQIDSIGSCLAVSLVAPATVDEAGFEAKADWVLFPDYETIADMVQTREETRTTNMCTGDEVISLGPIKHSDQEFTLYYDPKDPSQMDLATGFGTNVKVYTREVDAAGDKWYSVVQLKEKARARTVGVNVKMTWKSAVSKVIEKLAP